MMFTGIVSNTSAVKSTQSLNQGLLMKIEKPSGWNDLVLGESIATNGVCLTVSEIHEDHYECILVPETLDKSVFGKKVPDYINLERSLKVSERFGGHFVQGHVDCVGKVINIDNMEGYIMTVSYPSEFDELVIPKGSICINGVSLTVVTVCDNTMTVAIIPHTLDNTTVGTLKEDDMVNLEFDVIGKYIAKQVHLRSS
jgi:riboflavin synthase